MKKKILFVAALFTAGLSFAQDGLTSKKGVPILPEAGDYAIGFDAGNLLNYGGNLMNGAAGNSLNNLNLMNANTIYGKYFVEADKAYRGMVRLGFGSTNNKTLVPDLDPNAQAGDVVEDEAKTSYLAITVGGGIEMRRGKGRLQGVYGPQAMISFSSNGTENTYGNDITATNTGPRQTESKSGSTFGLAVGGFGGIEYFFAPKMSFGAEIGWTINLSTTGNGEVTTEAWDPVNSEVQSTTTETGGSSSFSLDTRPNGVISLNFHF